jgi:hypothetical protein
MTKKVSTDGLTSNGSREAADKLQKDAKDIKSPKQDQEARQADGAAAAMFGTLRHDGLL